MFYDFTKVILISNRNLAATAYSQDRSSMEVDSDRSRKRLLLIFYTLAMADRRRSSEHSIDDLSD